MYVSCCSLKFQLIKMGHNYANPSHRIVSLSRTNDDRLVIDPIFSVKCRLAG